MTKQEVEAYLGWYNDKPSIKILKKYKQEIVYLKIFADLLTSSYWLSAITPELNYIDFEMVYLPTTTLEDLASIIKTHVLELDHRLGQIYYRRQNGVNR